MNVLVINCGSSSIKYQLLDMAQGRALASGLVERIGEDMGRIKHKRLPDTPEAAESVCETAIGDHKTGMNLAIDMLIAEDTGVVASVSEIGAVGHRVVHGGEEFHAPTLITPEVVEQIRAMCELAPLHNPVNLVGIRVAMELMPGTPQVAVFDTAFHQTMPPRAFIYPLPYEYYEKLRIRRYGFHGTSHGYVTKAAAKFLGKRPEDVNLITLHLGNGCSMAAVKNGKCMDTTMGLTPLAGLMMGTRCGDIDPAIIAFLAVQKEMTAKEIDQVLNKQSGLKGICGMNDMRDIHEAREKGDKRAELAFEMFCYRIKHYIGAYYAVLGNVDALVFTAGIGENDEFVRSLACADMPGLGIALDEEKNLIRSREARDISLPESRVRVLVVPTDEELEIASVTMVVVDT